MKRSALLILLLTAAAGTLGCGFIGGSSPEGPVALVPDGAREVVLVDVGEAALNRTDLPANLESSVSPLENFGDVRVQAEVSLATGDVMITSGDFAFDDIRKSLTDGGYTEAAYRGYNFWESDDGGRASALLDEDGFLIDGDFEAVIEVLRSQSRDSGLLWNDEEGELNQAMELAGTGLVTVVSRYCGLADNRGCRAVAWSFSRSEERRTVIEGTAAVLFRNASAATTAVPLIEQAIGANPVMSLTEIVRVDSTLTLKTDIDRDQFASLEVPVTLGR